MKHILSPQYNLNLICVTWASQSEGHWETERHAGSGKSHAIRQLTHSQISHRQTIRKYLSRTHFIWLMQVNHSISVICFICAQVLSIHLYSFCPQSSSDKRFLVKQHATMLRRQKNTGKVRAAATTEDTPRNHLTVPPSTHTNWLKSPSCRACSSDAVGTFSRKVLKGHYVVFGQYVIYLQCNEVVIQLSLFFSISE